MRVLLGLHIFGFLSTFVASQFFIFLNSLDLRSNCVDDCGWGEALIPVSFIVAMVPMCAVSVASTCSVGIDGMAVVVFGVGFGSIFGGSEFEVGEIESV